jgi:hypothetical protein
VLPFAAVIAGRMLGGGLVATRLRVKTLVPLLGLVLVGYGCTLIGGALQPPQPDSYAGLIRFLEANHLRYGLSGYWESSIVTVDSGGAVTIRAVASCSLQPYPWESKTTWYDPKQNVANFVLIRNFPNGYQTSFEPSGTALGKLTSIVGGTINEQSSDYGYFRVINGKKIYLYRLHVYPGQNLLALLQNHSQFPADPPACTGATSSGKSGK